MKITVRSDGFEGYKKRALTRAAKARRKALSISALATELNRDPKSVRRDVLKLESAGVVRLHEQINPGHGRVRIVEPTAKRFELIASF